MQLTIPGILIRASAMFLIGLALMRTLGKPSIGELSTMDFVVITIAGDPFDSVIYGEVSILRGAVSLVTIVLLHLLVSFLSARNTLIFRLVNSPPRVLIQKGAVLGEVLAVERVRVETVEEQMRLKGEDQLAEVREATLETNGKLSVLKTPSAKRVQKKDLKLLRQRN